MKLTKSAGLRGELSIPETNRSVTEQLCLDH